MSAGERREVTGVEIEAATNEELEIAPLVPLPRPVLGKTRETYLWGVSGRSRSREERCDHIGAGLNMWGDTSGVGWGDNTSVTFRDPVGDVEPREEHQEQ